MLGNDQILGVLWRESSRKCWWIDWRHSTRSQRWLSSEWTAESRRRSLVSVEGWWLGASCVFKSSVSDTVDYWDVSISSSLQNHNHIKLPKMKFSTWYSPIHKPLTESHSLLSELWTPMLGSQNFSQWPISPAVHTSFFCTPYTLCLGNNSIFNKT